KRGEAQHRGGERDDAPAALAILPVDRLRRDDVRGGRAAGARVRACRQSGELGASPGRATRRGAGGARARDGGAGGLLARGGGGNGAGGAAARRSRRRQIGAGGGAEGSGGGGGRHRDRG